VSMSLHPAVQKPEKKENPMLAIAPCSVCPVFHECAPGNTISPETCRYIDDWIDF
jgi:DNA-directed RNA polymerase III subunit RPC6